MLKYVLSILHMFCRHPGQSVIADLNQGDVGTTPCSWCQVCGAVRRQGDTWEEARSPWIRWWVRPRQQEVNHG